MKREILCWPCASHIRKTLGDGSNYRGEHVKYVEGLAKKNPYTDSGISLCDHCGDPLPPSSPCVAVSIWAEYSGIPYSEWESEFIVVNGEKK